MREDESGDDEDAEGDELSCVIGGVLYAIKNFADFEIGHTLCSKKSDAKIQITITTAYLIRIKYPLSGFNYHRFDVNVANFNKIHRTVSKQQLF